MIRRLLLFIMWFVALPFLSLPAQSPGGEIYIEQQDTCRGYVGIQGTAKELISLGKFFQEYIKAKGNSMKNNFQIPNNSNYGNNEKANSNIGQ